METSGRVAHSKQATKRTQRQANKQANKQAWSKLTKRQSSRTGSRHHQHTDSHKAIVQQCRCLLLLGNVQRRASLRQRRSECLLALSILARLDWMSGRCIHAVQLPHTHITLTLYTLHTVHAAKTPAGRTKPSHTLSLSLLNYQPSSCTLPCLRQTKSAIRASAFRFTRHPP